MADDDKKVDQPDVDNKKDEPKKEEPKKEEPKKDEPKKDEEPKKEEPKKDDVEKDDDAVELEVKDDKKEEYTEDNVEVKVVEKENLTQPGDSVVQRIISEVSAHLDEDLAHKKKKDGAKPTAQINIDHHIITLDELTKRFNTDLKNGHKDDKKTLEELEERWGRNELTEKDQKHWILVFLSHLGGFFNLLLWTASILCFVAYAANPALGNDNLYLGIVLAGVTLITGIFSYWQDRKSSAAMAAFKKMMPQAVLVRRNGKEEKMNAADIFPGDVVQVRIGEKLPCDIRVLSAVDFKVNNSSLTGEPIALKRFPENTEENYLRATNLAFYGTSCVEGQAWGVAILTGDHTVIGQVAALADSTEKVQTPINIEIEHFILIVSAIAITLGILFLSIGFIKGFPPVNNLVFAIGIIVANVPEGLLATVTVSLTLTAKRMAKKNVLVKNLESVETLGSTNVIASDKTGTLTQNNMTVVNTWFNGKLRPASEASARDLSDPTFEKLFTVANLCNNCKFVNKEVTQMDANDKPVLDAEGKEVKDITLWQDITIAKRPAEGDASETALLKFVSGIIEDEKNAEYFEDQKDFHDHRANNHKIFEIPFNSRNKFQLSIHTPKNNKKANRILVIKGAPERIWKKCSDVLIDGKEEPKEQWLDQYNASQEDMMFNGERVFGFAYLELDADQYPEDNEEKWYSNFKKVDDTPFPSKGYVFAGLLSLMDPPRPEVPPAVSSCQKAGIRVIMVTGDHQITAEAISKQVKIITLPTIRDIARREKKPVKEISPDHDDIGAIVISGDDLLTMSSKDLDKALNCPEIVFARTSPKQKLKIVKAIQAKRNIHRKGIDTKIKHVVAVTGDGVNDSPALKAADIGIAMGLEGTEVARDSADMILLDDNFASIVKGIEEGRLIFDNLKKSIAYTLSSNIPEITPFLMFIIANIPLPLETVLILLIDLGTDLWPAISLAYEGSESNIMDRPPRDMFLDRLVTTKLVSFSYLQVGMIQALGGFFAYFVVLNDYGFPSSSLSGWGNEFKDTDRHTYLNVDGSETGFGTLPSQLKWEWNEDATGSDRADIVTSLKTCDPYFQCSIEFDPNNTLGLGDGETWRDLCACHNPLLALRHAQCAFFVAIIIVQWADLVACKTRTLSLKDQGMRNGVMNSGLIFETVLGALIVYLPFLNSGVKTAPIKFVHWLCALPFSMFILLYDETRKYLMRTMPQKQILAKDGKTKVLQDNWMRRFTYY